MVKPAGLFAIDRRRGHELEEACMKPVSLIIITYNRPDDMLALVENISGLEGLEEWVEEVIIVNNHSSVSYRAVGEFIRERPTLPFRYFDVPENLGVSR